MQHAPVRPRPHPGAYLLLACLLTLGGCEPDSPSAQSTGAVSAGPGAATADESAIDQQALGQLAARTARLRRETATATSSLCEAVRTLLDEPGDTHLALARSSWISAHRRYKALETLLKLQGSGADAAVDAWPALGGYIDRAAGYPHSGIVYDTTIEIDADALLAQHQLTDTSEVAIGFHALEYLLWGDPDDTPRSAALFGLPGAGNKPDARAIQRRRSYLRTACLMLAEQIGGEAPLAAPPARQLFAGAGRMLHPDLTAHVERVMRLGLAEDECAFSQQGLCGVLPAVSEILQLTEDAQLADTLRGNEPSLAEGLQSAGAVLREQAEALETADSWDATLASAMLESLRTLGNKLREAAAALPAE